MERAPYAINDPGERLGRPKGHDIEVEKNRAGAVQGSITLLRLTEQALLGCQYSTPSPDLA